MKASLILCFAAVMAAILPATLFAQTVPVVQPAPPAAVVAAPVAKTIPVTVPDPKSLATVKPAAARAASTKTVSAKRPRVKRPTVKAAVAKPSTVTRPARKAVAVAKTTTVAVAKSTASDADTARSVLAALKGTYRYLDGVTVSMGKTPGGYQAVSYYTKGRILISPTHRATISRILRHEIWHIIDWRDNGKIDWRESVPPHNAADYLK